LIKACLKKNILLFNEYVKNKASYLSYVNGSSFDGNQISVKHVDSQNEPCLQAVDSIAGAYFQAYERNDNKYIEIIKDKVSNFMLWPRSI
jgi:hypothetical protein